MAPNGSGKYKILAEVYPGVFPGEYQVTLKIPSGGEINLNVSEDFVVVEQEPTENGVSGYLKVDILGQADDGFLVGLPGEPQGTPNRIRLSREMLQVA